MLARLAFALVLIVPPMALAADAPPSGGKITVVQPPPKPADAAAAPTPASAPPPAATSAIPRDGDDCRMDCAQSYYQCRADDQDGACGGSWSQCLAACNSPNLAPAFSTTP